MRHAILARSCLVSVGVCLGAALALGCGGGETTGSGGSGGGTTASGGAPGAGGGGGPATTTEMTTSSTTTTTTTTTDTGPNPCDPTTADGCLANGIPSDCAAIVDNSAQDVFGLRMGYVSFQLPSALAGGLAGSLVQGAVLWDLPLCNFNGTGTFSLLFEIDSPAGTLKLGGAKPVADPAAGYCFVNGTVGGSTVSPATVMASVGADGTIDVPNGANLVIPVYVSDTTIILLPTHNVKLTNSKLSADKNCIGSYNLADSTVDNSCSPDPAFLTGGALDGHITLEEADAIEVTQLGQTLCAFLTGQNDGGVPKKCPRDPMTMKITAMGDWCSATDSPGDCADSMKLLADFAASAVTINGDCP